VRILTCAFLLIVTLCLLGSIVTGWLQVDSTAGSRASADAEVAPLVGADRESQPPAGRTEVSSRAESWGGDPARPVLVTGQVLSDGAPCRGATVAVLRLGDSMRRQPDVRYGELNAIGEFAIPLTGALASEPTVILVVISPQGDGLLRVVHEVSQRALLHVAGKAARPTLRGRISPRDCGSDVKAVALLSADGTTGYAAGEVSADGAFDLPVHADALTASRLVLQLLASEHREFTRVTVGDWSGVVRAVERDLEVPCVQHTITVPPTPDGVHPDRLELSSVTDGFTRHAWLSVTDGLARATLVPGTTYKTLAQAKGVDLAVGVVRESPRMVRVEWVESLRKTHTAEFYVVDQAGEPVPDCGGTCALLVGDPIGDLAFSANVDMAGEPGRLLASGLPPGRYAARVSTIASSGRRKVKFAFEVPGPNLRVVMPDHAALALHLLFPAGASVGAVESALVASRTELQRDWRLSRSGGLETEPGVIAGLGRGVHEVWIQVPPCIGSALVNLDPGVEVNVARVNMRWEDLGRGQLIDEHGRAIAGRWVTVGDVSPTSAARLPWSMARSDTRGHFQVGFDGSNSAELCVWDADARAVARRVSRGNASHIVIAQ
jgi:hypothetical protein